MPATASGELPWGPWLADADLSRLDALLLGPGLGALNGQWDAWAEPLVSFQGLLVLDADGLNALAASKQGWRWLCRREFPTWITPHGSEFARLFPDCNGREPLERAQWAAAFRYSQHTLGVVIGRSLDCRWINGTVEEALGSNTVDSSVQYKTAQKWRRRHYLQRKQHRVEKRQRIAEKKQHRAEGKRKYACRRAEKRQLRAEEKPLPLEEKKSPPKKRRKCFFGQQREQVPKTKGEDRGASQALVQTRAGSAGLLLTRTPMGPTAPWPRTEPAAPVGRS